jgi:hypothetical protein
MSFWNATSRKVVGSISNAATEFFQFTWSIQPHYDSGVDSTSNINEYHKSSWV